MKRLILLFFIFFIAIGVYLISLPPRDITLDDLSPSTVRNSSTEMPVTLENTTIDSSVTNDIESSVTDDIESSVTDDVKSSVTNDIESSVTKDINSSVTNGYEKTGIYYYIIVESFKNLSLAKQKAEKLKKDFKTDIYVLPPSKEGYYRISYGQYSTMDEARSAINGVKKNFGPNVWIFYEK